jgi:hypothetical protein
MCGKQMATKDGVVFGCKACGVESCYGQSVVFDEIDTNPLAGFQAWASRPEFKARYFLVSEFKDCVLAPLPASIPDCFKGSDNPFKL